MSGVGGHICHRSREIKETVRIDVPLSLLDRLNAHTMGTNRAAWIREAIEEKLQREGK